MARSKNGCLKILVCAGSGSDPSADADADADAADHPDEVSAAACPPPLRRGMRRLLLSLITLLLSSFPSGVFCTAPKVASFFGLPCLLR
jgi:hypothetical protein